ncbi:MAG: ArnT family glycosyltransferase [Chthonomonadales bacterium]
MEREFPGIPRSRRNAMMAIAEALCILALAHGVGLAVLRSLAVKLDRAGERIAYATALGLGVIAYGVLAIGLAGQLTAGGLFALTAVLGCASAAVLIGVGKARIRDPFPNFLPGRPTKENEPCALSAGDTPGRADLHSGGTNPAAFGSRLVVATAVAALLVLALIAMINCFVPPGAHEWDALSYHLAAPKVFIRQHRIVYLPTDHHSNFPFTVEMLFTAGLLLQGYALANLMHFSMGVLCIVLLWTMGRRYFGPAAAALAALVFATAPIVVWEAGSAYIELGLTLFSLASIAALLRYEESRLPSWIALAGVLAGFALSVKALALIPFAASALILGFLRPGLKRWGLFVGIALAVGSPFYIKSWIWTGNPVYPFAYRIFGGRDWSADRAAAYAAEQQSFGQSGNRTTVADDANGLAAVYSKPSVAQRLRNLILAPFDLVALPSLFYNHNDPGVRTHLGFLWLSLAPLALLTRRRLIPCKAFAILAAIALLWFLAWDLSMQYVRYLIPVLALASLIGGAAAESLVEGRRVFGGAVGAAVVVQFLFTLLYYGPTLPAQWIRASDASAREEYLERSVNCYGAEMWINQHTPKDAGVVLFEDTRGFYLDRPYLWGNSPHSAYIPYERFHSGRDMADWFLAHAIQYAILNLQFAPANDGPDARMALIEAVQNGTTPRLAMEWYAPERQQGEKWRALVGDAMRTGAAVPIPEACSRATVVLRFTPREGR